MDRVGLLNIYLSLTHRGIWETKLKATRRMQRFLQPEVGQHDFPKRPAEPNIRPISVSNLGCEIHMLRSKYDFVSILDL